MTTPKLGKPVRGSWSGRPIMVLLDLLGRRWTLRVLWELREGSLGFRVLQDRCDAMSPSVLSQRLMELQEARIVQQNADADYILTQEGITLLQALAPLNNWAFDWAEHLQNNRRYTMTPFEEIVLAYVEAWSESVEEKRRILLEKSWAENALYSDPTGQVVGREALVKHIGSIQQQRPGHRVLITSGIDEHHGQLRFTWTRVHPEGLRVAEGIDFGEVGSDGRLTRIIGFFGPPLPMPSSWPTNVTR